MATEYEILYGHKPDEPEPEEFRLFNRLAKDIMDLVPRQGSAVVAQVAVQGMRHDLDYGSGYLQYVFFAFNENRRSWPNLPPRLYTALMMGRWVMTLSTKMPNYSDGLKVPPDNQESAVDKTLVELAKWCDGPMRLEMATAYLTALKPYAGAYARMNPDIPAGRAITYLKTAFEERVRETPMAITDGEKIDRLIRFFDV